MLPDAGYHAAVRELCTRYCALLIVNETHTINAGPGGCTRAWGLEPDFVTIGKTLGAGNALSLAAMRATLGQVMTDKAFEQMIALGERFEQGVHGVIESRGLPWHAVRLGCRVEYLFRTEVASNGAAAGQDERLDPYIHLYLLNRGILMTPFHNMALMSPATTAADVDRHTQVFAEMADELIGA